MLLLIFYTIYQENPCNNGGFCQEHCTDVIVYECQCANGYVGQNCTEVNDEIILLILYIIK